MGFSKKIIGILIIVGALFLPLIDLWLTIYSIILIILGIMFILYNSEENKIEKRKDINIKKTKKIV